MVGWTSAACRICSGAHEPELRSAVLRIRQLLSQRLMLTLTSIAKSKPRSVVHGGLNIRDLTLSTESERRLASRKDGFGNRRKQAEAEQSQ